MIKIKISIRTVTSLQFSQKNELESDIKEKVLAADPNLYEAKKCIQNVYAIVPENVEKRETVRRKYHNESGKTVEKTRREEVFYLPAGIDLLIIIEINEDAVEDAAEPINAFIKALGEGKIRIGKNTTLGCGRCICTGADFESEKVEDVFGLALLTDFLGQTEVTGLSGTILFTSRDACDRIEADFTSEDGILIHNSSGKLKLSDGNNPEVVLPYATDDKNSPIIPASTWKGIFRTAASEWIKYNKDDFSLIDRMFGNREKGIKGCLVFYDSAIRDFEIKSSTRIHIDKLSATAIDARDNYYIAGNSTIRIECLEDMKPYIKYLYAVLRDLNFGRINVGADKGIGKGFINIISIRQRLSGEMKTVL